MARDQQLASWESGPHHTSCAGSSGRTTSPLKAPDISLEGKQHTPKPYGNPVPVSVLAPQCVATSAGQYRLANGRCHEDKHVDAQLLLG